MITEIVVYYSDITGKKYSTRESAEYDEELYLKIEKANERFQNGENLYDVLKDLGVARYRLHKILKKINRDTKLKIPHWQCRNTPGYQVIKINPDLTIFVHGDAGSWSGPYGENVTIEDLVRYMNNN